MNFIEYLLPLAVTLLGAAGLNAQKDTDVLFTVDGEPVTVGEFRYIYTKTNAGTANFNRENVTEYLDLYERFKLKVARAKAMGLDTVTALQNELAGYRRQLADNYLMDKQVTDRLVEELYARKQTDVDFSHILLPFKGNPTDDDRQKIEVRANDLKKTLTAGNFAEKATTYSGDNYSKERGGRIGFISVPFPRGLHKLEDALYAAEAGDIVGPVRSPAGYHLLLKHDSRPARGEIEVAHILVRKPEGAATSEVPAKIEQAKMAIAGGEDFGKVAARLSEDKKTARNEGYLGFFGINRYEPAFENAAFGLATDGDVSDIVETSAGYHLIKRISRRSVQPLSDARPLLEKQIKADARYADAKDQMVLDLRDKFSVNVDEAAFGRYAATLVDSSFFDFQWTPAPAREKGVLITFADGTTVGFDALQNYYRKNNRKRVSLGRNANANAFMVAKKLFGEWVNEQVLSYAKSRLEKDYSDFAALMREYREGILLFEATKMEVWDKASEDTLGLQQFFAANRDDYRFEERAEVTEYVVNVRSGLDAQQVYDFTAANGKDVTVAKFGKGVTATTVTLTAAEAAAAGLDRLKAGVRSAVANVPKQGTATFAKIETVLPARNKELREARGYVIADYQDQLEREWVERLRKQFPVTINKKTLNKLIEP